MHRRSCHLLDDQGGFRMEMVLFRWRARRQCGPMVKDRVQTETSDQGPYLLGSEQRVHPL